MISELRLTASGNVSAVLMMRYIFAHLQTIAEWIVEIDRLRIWLMPRNAIAERAPVSLDVGQVRDERLIGPNRNLDIDVGATAVAASLGHLRHFMKDEDLPRLRYHQ